MRKSCVVTIQKYSKKGVAQGIADGLQKPVEVRGAHLNEKLLVEIFRRKKGVHEATLLECLEPNPARVPPRCRHAPVCGGCSWQELAYEKQVVYKENHIKQLFQDYEEAEVYPILSMEDPWYFRGKMEFTFSQDKEGKKYLGLIMAGSKGKVVTLSECHLARPWMVQVLRAVQTFWEKSPLQAYNRIKNTGTLETLTLREGIYTQEKLVMLTIAGEPSSALSKQELEAFKQAVLEVVEGNPSLFLQIRHAAPGRKTQFTEMLLQGPDHIHEKLHITYPGGSQRAFTFKISPMSFFQPNVYQAEKLMSRALAMVTLKKDLKVLDLYCGTATFGLVFAPLAKEVLGIELNPYAVFDAEVNKELNGITNLTVLQGDVAEILSKVPPSFAADLMIVDPPRAGLGDKAIDQVLHFQPQEILYVSCNPFTQKEDIQKLVLKGYQVAAIQPVDQFAHSFHLENLALLKRKI